MKRLTASTLALLLASVALAQPAPTSPPTSAPSPIQITVHPDKPLGPISPLIYGLNHMDGRTQAGNRHIPFARQGGNRMSAYNWENNASNAGHDYHHQNDDYLGGGDTPGEVVRKFVEPALRSGTSVLITVPFIDYVAADKAPDGDVNKTPDYLQSRFHKNVLKKSAPFSSPPDLTDKVVYQDEFVAWIDKTTAPLRTPTAQLFYSLDNEPDTWATTHPRIRPTKITYAEIVDRTTRLSAAIKDVNPAAVIFGFVSVGYAGYRDLGGAPDSQGRDFLDFFLTSMSTAEKTAGHRLMDVLDLHWYSEARGSTRVTDNVNDPATVRARVQAPRSLWDPTYLETSWIANNVLREPIALLPRVWKKINAHYPGTKLAFTEYDYGGGDHISGAIAVADVLGIFSENNIYAAAMWGSAPFYFAGFDAYLNFDGKGTSYGDTALTASSSDIAKVSVHASSRSTKPGEKVVILINRSESPETCTLNLGLSSPATANLFRVQGTDPTIKPAGTQSLKGADPITLPPMSITVLSIAK